MSTASRSTMRSSLLALANASLELGGYARTEDALGLLPWERLRRPECVALRNHLADRYAPRTVNRHLSALRGLLRIGVADGMVPAQEGLQAMTALRNVPESHEPTGTLITQDELAAMLARCGPGPLGVRDGALLAVLACTGLRRAEVSGLLVADLDRATGALRVRRAKRNRVRTVYVLGAAVDWLERWLDLRDDLEADGAPLFCRVKRGGVLDPRPLSPRSVGLRVQAMARSIGRRDISAHDYRRTVISGLLGTTDISTVARLVGHADVRTTAGYDRRGVEEQREAAERYAQELGFPRRLR